MPLFSGYRLPDEWDTQMVALDVDTEVEQVRGRGGIQVAIRLRGPRC